ncbi:MAG: exo-alpha-sialidase [Candidatus Heimdallarchaeota archaeon]|nr:exo-alpha-sialidase [Candidatus Heimdallarchaeota archaeon]
MVRPQKVFSILQILSSFIFLIAVTLFFFYNAPIYSNFMMILLLAVPFTMALVIVNLISGIKEYRGEPRIFESIKFLAGLDDSIGIAIMHIGQASLLIYVFFKAALIDYWQPFSLYDIVIYLVAISWTFYSIVLFTSAVRFILQKFKSMEAKIFPGLTITSIILLLLVPGLLLETQINTPLFTDGLLMNTVLFEDEFAGYDTHRIPSITVIPAGARLNNSVIISDDIIICLVESRRSSALDNGEIDLTMRRSIDAGKSWSDLIVVKTWDNKNDNMKFGNPTPVFDFNTGIFFLLFNQGSKTTDLAYETYILNSTDGMATWGDSRWIDTGILGPGHGIQMEISHISRLVVPTHDDNGAYILYSDDHGVTWIKGGSMPEKQGNEVAVAELSNGSLYMNLRRKIGVSTIHGPLYRQISISNDGGLTWSIPVEDEELITPICMAGLSYSHALNYLYFTNPATYYSRADLTIKLSVDDGHSWEYSRMIYDGPSGYSDIGQGSDGSIYIFLENGRVEYSARINLVQISADWIKTNSEP